MDKKWVVVTKKREWQWPAWGLISMDCRSYFVVLLSLLALGMNALGQTPITCSGWLNDPSQWTSSPPNADCNGKLRETVANKATISSVYISSIFSIFTGSFSLVLCSKAEVAKVSLRSDLTPAPCINSRSLLSSYELFATLS